MKQLGLSVLLCAVVGCNALIAQSVGFEQRVGEALPLQAAFTDEFGQETTLGTILAGKPAVLCFNYFRCPELCSVIAEGEIDAMRQLQASVGDDFSVISISIDPTDTPAMAKMWKERDVSRYGRTGAFKRWHVLTGSAASIRTITSAAGFGYSYDPNSRQFAHPSGILILTADGLVSRYFLGVDYPAPDFASAIRYAAQNKVGQPVFDLVVNCIEGGFPGGRHGKLIWSILCAAVVLTALIVFGGIALMLRQEFKGRVRPLP